MFNLCISFSNSFSGFLASEVNFISTLIGKNVIKHLACNLVLHIKLVRIFYTVFSRREIIERKTRPDMPKLEVRNSAARKRGFSPRNPSS